MGPGPGHRERVPCRRVPRSATCSRSASSGPCGSPRSCPSRVTVSRWSRSPCSSSTGRRSPLLAALAYAAGYLPWVIGGLFLADVADRRPRRSVMVTCDAVRTVLVAAMAVPGVPLRGPGGAAVRDHDVRAPVRVGAGRHHPGHPAGRDVTSSAPRCSRRPFLAGQVVGAAGGGLAVAFIGVRACARRRRGHVRAFRLAHRAGHPGPASRREAGDRPSRRRWPACGGGFRLVFGDRALRTLLLFGWLVVFYTVPEGIAAPYANKLGGGPIATGVVLASTVSRHHHRHAAVHAGSSAPRQRLALMGPLAVLHLRDAGPDGPPSGSCRLARDLLAVGYVRRLPDRSQHRLRRQGSERTAGSGLRHCQHGCGRWPGGRFRSGRRRGRGGLPGGGHRRSWRNRSGYRIRTDAQVAPRVTTRRASCGRHGVPVTPRPEDRCRYAVRGSGRAAVVLRRSSPGVAHRERSSQVVLAGASDASSGPLDAHGPTLPPALRRAV